MPESTPPKGFDLILLSNGPGELLTWVKPMLKTIREQKPKIRVTLLLSPCTHASGHEAEIAQKDFAIERVLEPRSFFSFLIFGKTPQNWTWYKNGSVLFLGGDQAFTWMIAKRLAYKSIIYAEYECRWHKLIDHFACQRQLPKVKKKYKDKFLVVGDLTAEAVSLEQSDLLANWQKRSISKRKKQISLLPGSKGLKLKHSLPMMLGVAETLLCKNPDKYSFIIYLAPGLKTENLINYMPPNNPYNEIYKGSSGIVVQKNGISYIKTKKGQLIYICQDFPTYHQLAQSDLALCTVGTVTKELGRLAVPMVVLTPYMLAAHKLYEFDNWDGLIGLFTKIPFLGKNMIKALSKWALKKPKFLAWPNIDSQQEIVPEIRSAMTAKTLADYFKKLINNNKACENIRNKLEQRRTSQEKKPSEIILSLIKS